MYGKQDHHHREGLKQKYVFFKFFVFYVGEQAALQEVYGDDVELCDVLVGNLAEDKIEGFAIRYVRYCCCTSYSFGVAQKQCAKL